MANCSQFVRHARALLVGICCASSMALFQGCQSAAQYDQIAREMRMQEDELYAMEDYLEQYQQLVCKYRAENAALKRQLAASGQRPATERRSAEPDPAASQPERSLDVTPPENGAVPPDNLQPPDVPPLGETTQSDSSTPPVADVWLRGEVVAPTEDSGPRLMVEVQPLDATGHPAPFEGAISLMLMAAGDQGEPVNVARWDYRPEEIRAATDRSDEQSIARFHLELPPESAASEAREIWVRLLPRTGGKLLTHSPIDILQAGLFSSREEPEASDEVAEARQDDSVIAAVHETTENENPVDSPFEPVDTDSPITTSTEIFDGGWTVATPGRPAGLPEQNAESKSSWRASLEPVPIATAVSTETRPTPPRVKRSNQLVPLLEQIEPATPQAAGWSPDRSGPATPKTARTALARPAWSSTR